MPTAGGPPSRSVLDFMRKLGAIVLVLASVTCGIVGLVLVVGAYNWWGLLALAVAPLGVWLATRVTPEGGTTGYFDKNI